MRLFIARAIFFAALLSMAACAAVQTVADVGVQTGMISKEQGASIKKSSAAVEKSLEDFTPEQEYYIGRTVGALVLAKYKPLQNNRANQYLNVLGQNLAQASDKPELFNGYRFLVLNSDDINAFATPGGHVFITRGLIRCCRTEDMLAAVVAHEIAHIQLRHGMSAIEKARTTEALSILAQEGAKTFGSQAVGKLTEAFGGVISDIANTMINNGYSRSFEYQADAAAVVILQRAGYNPGALVEMLEIMGANIKSGGTDFAKTHPSPQNRIAELKDSGKQLTGGNAPGVRQQRFSRSIGQL